MTLFQLGDVRVSDKAEAALADSGCRAATFLSRHESGDWGEVEADVVEENEFATEHPHPMHLITSRYRLSSGAVLMLITSLGQATTLVHLSTEQTIHEVDAIEGYKIWSETYDMEVNPLIAAEGPRARAIFGELPMRTAIDVGAGTGRHTMVLARRGVAVTAVDQSPDMLAVARRKAARAGLEVDFRIGSLDDRLPADDDRFDFLVCALTLSHIPDIEHAVKECARVVRPGGSILISDIHPDVANGLGWTARLRRPGATYKLPFAGHTRSDYLDSLAAAGCSITSLDEVPVAAAPAGMMLESARQAFRDWKYCLIVVAKKDL